MKSSSRFIITAGAVIGVLIIIAIVLVFTSRSNVNQLSANTPQGTVQRYLQAINKREYPLAYSYVRFDQNGRILTYQQWLNQFSPGTPETTWKASIQSTDISGNLASVTVVFDVLSGRLNGNTSTQTVRFSLNMADGAWFITGPEYLWFLY